MIGVVVLYCPLAWILVQEKQNLTQDEPTSIHQHERGIEDRRVFSVKVVASGRAATRLRPLVPAALVAHELTDLLDTCDRVCPSF